jgi:hypothetical protein
LKLEGEYPYHLVL